METVRRVKNHGTNRLWDRTARRLAEFLEMETEGEISSAEILNHSGHLLDEFSGADYCSCKPLRLRNQKIDGTVEGEDWSGMSLDRLNAKDSQLKGVNLDRARLVRGGFQRAVITNCSFRRADLVGAKIQGAVFIGCDFTEADLTGVNAMGSHFERCVFKDATHTSLDMRNSTVIDCEWFADRFKGGTVSLLDGVDISQFHGISESHFISGEIVNRVSDRRPRFQMVAGFIRSKYMGCWQALISLMECELNRTERQEICDAFTEYEHWLIEFRLEYELQRREWLTDFFGTNDYTAWPEAAAERHAPILGRSCTVQGVPGHVGVRGLFVPQILAGKERFEGRDVRSDEMMALALANRNGRTYKR